MTGTDVVVSSTGHLGVVMSSARYKHDIRDMGTASARAAQAASGDVSLRIRTPQGIRQYGLVAEEVERVYPELVTYGADGKVATVRYSMLTSMLLNELQKQARQNDHQTNRLERQTEQLSRQARQIERLNAKVAQVEAAAQREIGAQRAAFEGRFSALEQSLQAQNRNRNLATAFNR